MWSLYLQSALQVGCAIGAVTVSFTHRDTLAISDCFPKAPLEKLTNVVLAILFFYNSYEIPEDSESLAVHPVAADATFPEEAAQNSLAAANHPSSNAPSSLVQLETTSKADESARIIDQAAILASRIAIDAVVAVMDLSRKFIQGRNQRKRAQQRGLVTAVPEELFKLVSRVQEAGNRRICTPLQQIMAVTSGHFDEYFDESKKVLERSDVERLAAVVRKYCPQVFLSPLPSWMSPAELKKRLDKTGSAVLPMPEWRANVRQSIIDGLRQAAKEELIEGQVAVILASSALPGCHYKYDTSTGTLSDPPKRLEADKTCASKLIFDQDFRQKQNDIQPVSMPFAEFAMRKGVMAPLRNVFRSGAMVTNLPFVRTSAAANWQETWCEKLKETHWFRTDEQKKLAFKGLLKKGHKVSSEYHKNVINAKKQYKTTVRAMHDCLMFGGRSKVLAEEDGEVELPADDDDSALLGTFTLEDLDILSPAQAERVDEVILKEPMSIDALLLSAGVEVPAHDIFGEAFQVMHHIVSKAEAAQIGKPFDPASVSVPEPVNDVLSLIQFAVGARADTFDRMEHKSDFFDPSENVARLVGNARIVAQAIKGHKESGKIKVVMKKWVGRQLALSAAVVVADTAIKAAALDNGGTNYAAQLANMAQQAGGSESAKYSILTSASLVQAGLFTAADQDSRAKINEFRKSGKGGPGVAFDMIARGALSMPLSTVAVENYNGESDGSTWQTEAARQDGAEEGASSIGDAANAVKELIQQERSAPGLAEITLFESLSRCNNAIHDGYPLSRVVLRDFANVIAQTDDGATEVVQVPEGFEPIQNGDDCGKVIMALENVAPSANDQTALSARSMPGTAWEYTKKAGLWLLKGPGLAIADFALANTVDVLGSTIFPILGLLKSIGKFFIAGYRLIREISRQTLLNRAAPLQHVIQYNDALYDACRVIQDLRQQQQGSILHGSRVVAALPEPAKQAVRAALADGLADISVAMQSKLARTCLGSRPNQAGGLPVLVRPYGSAESPQTVLSSIKLQSMLTRLKEDDDSYVEPPEYALIEATAPEAADGVTSKTIILATHSGLYPDNEGKSIDDVASTRIWSAPASSTPAGNVGSLLGALQLRYSKPSASIPHVSNLFYGIVTQRTKEFNSLPYYKRTFSKADNSRIAYKACPADQVAAGASLWAKHEYYGIGSEPSDANDKQRWDFPRVKAWAKEDLLTSVAEEDLVAFYEIKAKKGKRVRVQSEHPSRPFDEPVETCGEELKGGGTKYVSQAFFYAQHGGGAPIESVLLADPDPTRPVKRMGTIFSKGSGAGSDSGAKTIHSFISAGSDRKDYGAKLSFSIRIVVPREAVSRSGFKSNQVCLPKLSSTGTAFDQCKLQHKNWGGSNRIEEFNLIVTKNFVLPQADTAMTGTQAAEKAISDLSNLQRAYCIDPSSDSTDMCNGHGSCVLQIDAEHAVEEIRSVQKTEVVRGDFYSPHHMSWKCVCKPKYSGDFCKDEPPAAGIEESKKSLPLLETTGTTGSDVALSIKSELKYNELMSLRTTGRGDALNTCWTTVYGEQNESKEGGTGTAPQQEGTTDTSRRLVSPSSRTHLHLDAKAQTSTKSNLRFSAARVADPLPASNEDELFERLVQCITKRRLKFNVRSDFE